MARKWFRIFVVLGGIALLPPLFAPAANADTINYSGVSIGYCTVYLQVRSTDGYVRIKYENTSSTLGVNCFAQLFRKRYNTDGTVMYNWSEQEGVVFGRYTTGYTPWHWNGANAGSKGKLTYMSTGQEGYTSAKW